MRRGAQILRFARAVRERFVTSRPHPSRVSFSHVASLPHSSFLYASLLRLEAGPAADGCEFLTRRSKDLLLLTRLTPNCNDLERRVIASRRRAFRRARTRAHLQRRAPALVRDADQRGPGHGGRRIARPESVDRGWRQTLQRLIATPGVRQQTQRGSAEPVGQAWRAQVEDRELPHAARSKRERNALPGRARLPAVLAGGVRFAPVGYKGPAWVWPTLRHQIALARCPQRRPTGPRGGLGCCRCRRVVSRHRCSGEAQRGNDGLIDCEGDLLTSTAGSSRPCSGDSSLSKSPSLPSSHGAKEHDAAPRPKSIDRCRPAPKAPTSVLGRRCRLTLTDDCERDLR